MLQKEYVITTEIHNLEPMLVQPIKLQGIDAITLHSKAPLERRISTENQFIFTGKNAGNRNFSSNSKGA